MAYRSITRAFITLQVVATTTDGTKGIMMAPQNKDVCPLDLPLSPGGHLSSIQSTTYAIFVMEAWPSANPSRRLARNP
ncbi:hypothetical protein GGR50DRAFT_658768 [Xylaria sp. CBS 124048]|nr:hypothetical protein GGR50DRAFT_658768 [Xylaria sp. CBS 124048]